MIYWDYDGTDFENKTEVDSLQYAIDAVEGLIRMHGGNTDKPAENPYANATNDDIAGDIVTYMYDNYPGASYIGDKEGRDGSIMLRFDWGKEDSQKIAEDLTKRYGLRVSFATGQARYAPEIKTNFIVVRNATAVTEAIESLSPSLTEESVVEMLGELGLNVENKWFDGNKSRIVFDVKSHDGETICVWVEPPYEAKLWFKDRSNRNNGLIEDITNISTLKEELYAMVNEDDPEISLGNSIDTAMMDHYDMMNGDIGDIDFNSVSDADRLAIFEESVSKMCKAAGQEALTESVIELARSCVE